MALPAANYQPPASERGMSYAKIILGALISCLVAAGFLASFHAVNEAIPLRASRSEALEAQSVTHKEDRIQKENVVSKAEPSAGTAAGPEPHLTRICTNLDGKPFVWDWPNVPFATLSCDNRRRR